MADSQRIEAYPYFTTEQQDFYLHLNHKQQRYIDLRAKGFNQKDAYIQAGYASKMASQGAYMMEKNNAGIKELVEVVVRHNRLKGFNDEDSDITKLIDNKASQQTVERAMRIIDNADVETAQRIRFYRDIINGKIVTTRTTEVLSEDGTTIKSRKVEKVSDVETKMKARKELDRILGLSQVIDIGKLNVGDITINIVDASNAVELEDSRNGVELTDAVVREIDDEQASSK